MTAQPCTTQLEDSVRLRDCEFQLGVIRELGEAILSKAALYDVLQLVADRAREMVAADTVLVPMLLPGGEEYMYSAASGKDAESIKGVSFPTRIGMCGWVLSNQKPLLYGEHDDWPLANQQNRWEDGHTSAVLVPLIVQKQIIGGLSASGKVGGGSFTTRDMELLTLFANQVSIAIENARLLNDVNNLVTSLEVRVAERTAELQVANQELEAFSYSVSHDLRAPLRSINGFSQALLEDFGERLNDEGRGYLQRLRANAVQMGELIDAMLLLSRVTRSDLVKQQVDLSEMAQSVAGKLAEADPGRATQWVIAPSLTAQGDANLLHVLLDNLLSNAWKYSGKTAQPQIEFGITRLDDQHCYFVRDNGAGFDMAKAAKLFKPFQRLHAEREFAGTGIGLATVQRIVNRHGGWVKAEAAPGKGAVFYFNLGM
jgi:signal transduction histidine kinase